jgi:transcriptional regulator with XRE-family HTH domain
MDFSEWLEAKLEEKGWSRSEAARRGGISASMYDKVINGHAKPGLRFIEGVAKAFKMEVYEVWKYVSETDSISDEITRMSQELISGFQLEETKRKAYAQLKRLADEETKHNGVARTKHSPKAKTP